MSCNQPGCVKRNGPAHEVHEDERGATWTVVRGPTPDSISDDTTEPIGIPLVPDDDLEQPL